MMMEGCDGASFNSNEDLYLAESEPAFGSSIKNIFSFSKSRGAPAPEYAMKKRSASPQNF